MGVDWDRVSDWTARIVSGDVGPMRSVFLADNADVPEIVWEPDAAVTAVAPLRFVLESWWPAAAAGALPHIRQINPFTLRPALGYIMLLDPVEAGRDFRYRLFGSTVARISKFDRTGRLLSEQPTSPYVNEFSLASYRASLQQRRPLYTVRMPARAEITAKWPRVIIPCVDDAGSVARMLGVTAAVDATGRMIRA